MFIDIKKNTLFAFRLCLVLTLLVSFSPSVLAAQTWALSGTQTLTLTFSSFDACTNYQNSTSGFNGSSCSSVAGLWRFVGTTQITQGGFISLNECETYAKNNHITQTTCTGTGAVAGCVGMNTKRVGTCQNPCDRMGEGLLIADGQDSCAQGLNCCVSTSATAEVANAPSGVFRYSLLESLPGFYSAGQFLTDFPALILAIYKFGIWTIGIAGLFMLTIGGVTYMGSAGNTSAAGKAKDMIADALIGIVAAMIAYLVLYVINPDLTRININFVPVNVDIVTEAVDTSAESAGTLSDGAVENPTPGSCGGLSTQSGINVQCSSASSQLSNMLGCIAGKLPRAVITSISDSYGYENCTPNNWNRPPCAHAKYSCHYGGKYCYSTGKSYAVDISTRNLGANQIIAAARSCGASFTLDESTSANHVHASVGQAAGCGCN